MAKIFSVITKAGINRAIDPVARALLRAGVSPDFVTVFGTLGVVVAAASPTAPSSARSPTGWRSPASVPTSPPR